MSKAAFAWFCIRLGLFLLGRASTIRVENESNEKLLEEVKDAADSTLKEMQQARDAANGNNESNGMSEQSRGRYQRD